MATRYDDYYVDQIGHGRIKVFIGSANQKGNGIGSWLGGLFRRVLPLLKKGVRYAGKEAAKTGTNIVSDIVLHKVPIEQATRYRLRETSNNLKRKAKEKIDEIMRGSGYKRRKIAKKPHSRVKRSSRKTKKKIVRRKKSKKTEARRKKSSNKTLKKRKIEDIFIN